MKKSWRVSVLSVTMSGVLAAAALCPPAVLAVVFVPVAIEAIGGALTGALGATAAVALTGLAIVEVAMLVDTALFVIDLGEGIVHWLTEGGPSSGKGAGFMPDQEDPCNYAKGHWVGPDGKGGFKEISEQEAADLLSGGDVNKLREIENKNLRELYCCPDGETGSGGGGGEGEEQSCKEPTISPEFPSTTSAPVRHPGADRSDVSATEEGAVSPSPDGQSNIPNYQVVQYVPSEGSTASRDAFLAQGKATDYVLVQTEVPDRVLTFKDPDASAEVAFSLVTQRDTFVQRELFAPLGGVPEAVALAATLYVPGKGGGQANLFVTKDLVDGRKVLAFHWRNITQVMRNKIVAYGGPDIGTIKLLQDAYSKAWLGTYQDDCSLYTDASSSNAYLEKLFGPSSIRQTYMLKGIRDWCSGS